MAGVGLIDLKSSIFLTLGINIGTCVTAVLASIGATTNGKRASVIHLMFNVFGSIVFFILALCLPIDKWLAAAFPEIETQIAMFHTIFNVTTTLLLVGFIKYITRLSELIVRDKKQKPDEDGIVADKFAYVDERLLATPTIALAQVRKEIELMAQIAKKNLDWAIGAVRDGKFEKREKFRSRENHLNFLLKELTAYNVKLSTNPLTADSERELSSYYRAISDLERIGDYAENICEYADLLAKQKSSFSPDALKELDEMTADINELYTLVMRAFGSRDLSLRAEVDAAEQAVDDCKDKFEATHIERLTKGQCTADSGAVWLHLVNDLERVGDHIRNLFNGMSGYVTEKAPTKVAATAKQV